MSIYKGLKRYAVVKRFLPGTILEGIMITEITTVCFKVGFIGGGPWLGDPYEVLSVTELPVN